MNKKELRAKLIAEMKEMDAKAKAENRSFTDEENKAFSEKEAEIRKLDAEIEAEERAAKLNGFSAEPPKEEGNAESRNAEKPFFEVRKTGQGLELRTNMSVGDGGAAIAPEEFVNELIKEVEKEAHLYNRVRKISVTGAGSLGVPYEKADASNAEWTNEIPSNEIGSDSSWEFGKRELAPTDLVKQILLTKKLLASSALPIDTLAREKIAEKLRYAFENGIMVGSGTNEPLGVFTAATAKGGIPATQDVETKNAVASGDIDLTYDDFVNLKMKLRPAYRRNAVFVMSTAVLQKAMLIKDNQQRPIWVESMKDGEPGRILGIPVIESEFAPDTIAAGNYLVAIGNFDYYWFAAWKGIDIQVLNEKFAGTNQIGLLGHTLADGMPVLGAAFARLKAKE